MAIAYQYFSVLNAPAMQDRNLGQHQFTLLNAEPININRTRKPMRREPSTIPPCGSRDVASTAVVSKRDAGIPYIPICGLITTKYVSVSSQTSVLAASQLAPPIILWESENSA